MDGNQIHDDKIKNLTKKYKIYENMDDHNAQKSFKNRFGGLR